MAIPDPAALVVSVAAHHPEALEDSAVAQGLAVLVALVVARVACLLSLYRAAVFLPVLGEVAVALVLEVVQVASSLRAAQSLLELAQVVLKVEPALFLPPSRCHPHRGSLARTARSH